MPQGIQAFVHSGLSTSVAAPENKPTTPLVGEPNGDIPSAWFPKDYQKTYITNDFVVPNKEMPVTQPAPVVGGGFNVGASSFNFKKPAPTPAPIATTVAPTAVIAPVEVIVPVSPPDHPLVQKMKDQKFSEDEIAKVKAIVFDKLGAAGLDSEKRIEAFRELKLLSVCSASKVDSGLYWAS